MIALAMWMVVAVAVAVATVSRRRLFLIVVLAVRVLVPSAANTVLVGDWQGSSAMHASTLLLAVGFLVHLAALREPLGRVLARNFLAHVVLGTVVTAFVVVTVLLRGPDQLLGLANTLGAGLLVYLYVRALREEDPGATRLVALTLVSLAVVEAVLVVVQGVTGSLAPWGGYLGDLYLGRPLGTFDSPLDAAFFLASCIALTGFIRRPVWRVSTAVLLAAGVLLTQGRTAGALGVALAAVVAISVANRAVGVVGVLVAAGTFVYFLIATSVFDAFFQRLSGDDGSSASARAEAYRYAFDHLDQVFAVGGGWGAAYEVRGYALQTSLESGFLIYVFDLGLVLTLMLVAAVARIVFSGGPRLLSWPRVAAVTAALLAASYSGIATMGAASLVLWVLVALCPGVSKEVE